MGTQTVPPGLYSETVMARSLGRDSKDAPSQGLSKNGLRVKNLNLETEINEKNNHFWPFRPLSKCVPLTNLHYLIYI